MVERYAMPLSRFFFKSAVALVLAFVLAQKIARADDTPLNVAGPWQSYTSQSIPVPGTSDHFIDELQLVQTGTTISGTMRRHTSNDADAYAMYTITGTIEGQDVQATLVPTGDQKVPSGAVWYWCPQQTMALTVSLDGLSLDGTFSSPSCNNGEVHYRWQGVEATLYIWNGLWPFFGGGGSVGHVFLAGDGLHISTFPITSAHKNTLINLSLSDTILREDGRPPTWGYHIRLPNRSAFDAAMATYSQIPTWDWLPNGDYGETNCTDSALHILSAGGLQLPNVLTPHNLYVEIDTVHHSPSNGISILSIVSSDLPG